MSFLGEVKRRKIFQVAAVYAVVAWLIVQIIVSIEAPLHLPDWVDTLVIVLLAVGFPVTLIVSWGFNLTAEGLVKDQGHEAVRVGTKTLEFVLIGLLAIAVIWVVYRIEFETTEPVAQAPAIAEQAVENVAPESSSDVLPTSIAVLPFADMSPEQDQEYFADGISEGILNLLARVPELNVIARTSSFSFKDQHADIVEIARRLAVTHVLEGSVRKSGQRIRVTAQLVNGTTSEHLWSETYNRTLGDIFAIQDDISADVVDQLKVTLLVPVPKVRETDPEAYRLYLKATYLANQLDYSKNVEAESLYRQALQRDPSFAPAWRELSRVLWRQIGSVSSLDDDIRRTRDALDRALTIDSRDAGSIAYSAWQAMDFDGDVARAAELFEQAIAIEPANENVIRTALQFAIAIGQSENAIRIGESGIARNPLCYSCDLMLADAYRDAGRLDEAEHTILATQSLFGRLDRLDDSLGIILLLKGENNAASESFGKIENESLRRIRIGMAEYDSHRPEQLAAFRLFSESSEHILPWAVEEAYAWTGQNDAAFEAIYNATSAARSKVEDEIFKWDRIRIAKRIRNPIFHQMSNDPRWQALLENLGVSDVQLSNVEFNVPLPE